MSLCELFSRTLCHSVKAFRKYAAKLLWQRGTTHPSKKPAKSSISLAGKSWAGEGTDPKSPEGSR
jgi:hypothetical protein